MKKRRSEGVERKGIGKGDRKGEGEEELRRGEEERRIGVKGEEEVEAGGGEEERWSTRQEAQEKTSNKNSF